MIVFFCIHSCEVQDHEALGFANIINHLVTAFEIPVLVMVPADMLTSFVNSITTLTCLFGRKAALEEAVSVFDVAYLIIFVEELCVRLMSTCVVCRC